jgi:hypothetical protein
MAINPFINILLSPQHWKDMQSSQETLSTLLDEKAECLQRIRGLEDDIMVLIPRGKETEAELER